MGEIKRGEGGGREYGERQSWGSLGGSYKTLEQWKLSGIQEGDPSEDS